MSPTDSEDLTHIVEERNGEYVVFRSPDTAEHYPDYYELRSFRTEREAVRAMKLERRHQES